MFISIDKVDKHMTELKAYAYNLTKLIINEIRSSRGQPTQTSHQENDAHQHVEENEKARMDQPSVSMREYVDISNIDVGGVLNADIPGSSTSKPPTLDDYPDLTMTQIFELDPILNVTTTPDLQSRNRNPSKYDTSLSIRLSEGESSVKDKFEPQMDFGVVKISTMNFFNIMVKTDRPWEDGKKAKYSPLPLSYSTVDCWFMTWVDNIEKKWRDSNYDMRSIYLDHDARQYIRGFKLLANIPWDRVDDVIILGNVNKSFHWFLVVFRIKLRCLHVYDSMMGGAHHDKNINIVVENDDGAINESEVIDIVGSKFGGPRIAKEDAPVTSNYPTPRPRRSNLR
ncbi:hypothetical protein RDI58_007568 [Solanum bulbocastanum]|uniref:Ubiquitin-like protease family profile domain-containing protein n=1 Tax=Solanum bulbocastanum TaxID=147425 RepID=A0AAN8TV71_SOLBU